MKKKPIIKKLRWGLFLSIIYDCTALVYYVVKYVVNRPRPFIDHDVIVRLSSLPLDPSFPSGHTMFAFMMATIDIHCMVLPVLLV
jgi:membrane-associated phospholipid phosphatase